MVDKRDKSQRVVVASESRGERSCLFILRRSRHPECPVGLKSCRDLAETAPFRLFPGGLDTRNALWGRNPVATSLKPPHSASSREVATPEAPSRADSMERLHLPGEMPERRRMLAPRGVLLGDNLPDNIHLQRPVTRSSAAPRHPVACSAQPLINQQFKGIIYLLSTETP